LKRDFKTEGKRGGKALFSSYLPKKRGNFLREAYYSRKEGCPDVKKEKWVLH